jgi:hypothetical protein
MVILVAAPGRPGPGRPPSLIAHLAWRTESGLRYVDVWRSKDGHEAFAENRLRPVVHPILQEMPGFVPPSRRTPCSASSTPGPAGIPADLPGS